MTIYARPPRTLAVERHNGVLWLCAVGSGAPELLARFTCEAHAETFNELHTAAKAHAYASGSMGI